MNSTQLFTMGLGLTKPWFVSKVEFVPEGETKELHIHIDFEKGSRFLGKDGNNYTAYETKEGIWQHLNFFQHKCYIHARVPTIKDINNKKTTTEVPWARAGSGFTMLFEAYSMMLIEGEMPIFKVAKLQDVTDKRIWRVFNYWVTKAHNEDVIEDIKQIGFDETSTKKGHNYITTTVDLDSRRVLFASIGKGADCLKTAEQFLTTKNVNTNEIKDICIDMSPAFISGCCSYFPNSAITFDKFHVVKELNKAFDEFRRLEAQENKLIKKHKYTFLKNKLSSSKESQLEILCLMYPKLGEGYRLKQLFKDFWDITDLSEAETFLDNWCKLATDSGIFPFGKFINMVKAHRRGILNYIKSRINNGILEGINSKIQLAKKRARGFRNIKNFINMVYLTCGRLNFNYPS